MKTHQCHQHSYPNLIKKELPKAKNTIKGYISLIVNTL